MDLMKFNPEFKIQRFLEDMARELTQHVEGMSTDDLSEIEKYIYNHDEFLRRAIPETVYARLGIKRDELDFNFKPDEVSFGFDTEKIKVLLKLALSNQRINANDATEIIAFIDKKTYGWHSNKYLLNNHCLRNHIHGTENYCKKAYKIPDVETAEEKLEGIYNIFFHNDYGKYALYIFNYCLVALFSSKLNQDRIHTPFFLQIACDRSSAWYHLIQEIVSLCDVNSGIFEGCSYKDGHCGYSRCKTHYPTKSVSDDIEALVFDRDIPVIIDGHEHERHYNDLLRVVANISNKRKALDVRNRFNVLPVFICPVIKSSFNNVFDMDLTDLEISREYLTLFQENKQLLSSLVLRLVMDFTFCLFPHMNEPDKRKMNPFSDGIGNYITYVSTKYTDITLQNARNVGLLNFFFKGFMRAFQNTFTFPLDEKFECFTVKGKRVQQDREDVINMLTERSETSLAKLHKLHRPAPIPSGIVDKEALNLAKNIEKHYRELKAYIRVTPVDINPDRYIFHVDTLQGTIVSDVSKSSNVQTVQHRLKTYEYFRVDLTDRTTIKIIAAKEMLKEKSLMKILDSPDFKNTENKIPYAMGYDDTGIMCIKDIFECPHLLLGGATRSGKSTAMMCLLMSIAYKHRTGDVNVLILDLLGKAPSDFEVFNNQPILSYPVIKDAKTGLKMILKLEEIRADRMNNENLKEMPYIVCVIDEFPRLFSDTKYEDGFNMLEMAMTRLLSGGRHAKIHLVLAAQDPTKKHMVCGIANIPAKIALRVNHPLRSIAILGRGGANKLIGKGQMIFDYYDELDKRLQGAYISEADMKQQLGEIAQTFEQKNKYPLIIDDLELSQPPTESSKEGASSPQKQSAEDRFNEKLLKVIKLLLEQGKIANSDVINEVNVTFHTANKYMAELENYDLIPPLNSGRSARKLNPIEKVRISELRVFLENQGCSEDDIINAIDKIQSNQTSDQADLATQSVAEAFKKEDASSQPPPEDNESPAPEIAADTPASPPIPGQESLNANPKSGNFQSPQNNNPANQSVSGRRKNKKRRK